MQPTVDGVEPNVGMKSGEPDVILAHWFVRDRGNIVAVMHEPQWNGYTFECVC